MTPNMTAPPAPSPMAVCAGADWATPAPPWAHSCPLAFLLVPTPAIQWGLKPQEAGVHLPSLPHPMQIRSFLHLPCSLGHLRCSGTLRPGSPSLSLSLVSLAAFIAHFFWFHSLWMRRVPSSSESGRSILGPQGVWESLGPPCSSPFPSQGTSLQMATDQEQNWVRRPFA